MGLNNRSGSWFCSEDVFLVQPGTRIARLLHLGVVLYGALWIMVQAVSLMH
jgi:hypothetical protein